MNGIPRGWVSVRLGDVCELLNGRAYKQDELLNRGKYPVLRVGNFFSNRGWYYSDLELENDKYCDDGDLLYAWSASFGPKIWSGGKVIFHYHIWRTCLNEQAIAKRFLYHWFEWDKKNIKAEHGTGSTMIHVTKGDMEARPLCIPTVSEQQRIAAKVDTLSGKSGRARDHLDHLPRLVEKYKQAVLTAAFHALRSNGNLQPLRKCAAFVTSGSRGWAQYYSNEGPLFIRVANVRRGNIALAYDDVQRVTPPASAEGVRTLVQGNDILITITADLGRVGLVPENFEEAYVNQHVALLRLRDSHCARFIAWYLTCEDGQRQLLEQNRGMTRAGLGLDDIRAVSVPFPDPQVQLDVVNRIETAFAWIDRLASDATSARKLVDHLDQAVLGKAFRGELVPQDPSDEPASVLLQRIRAERATPHRSTGGRGRPRRTA